jgi:hypothetical protein
MRVRLSRAMYLALSGPTSGLVYDKDTELELPADVGVTLHMVALDVEAEAAMAAKLAEEQRARPYDMWSPYGCAIGDDVPVSWQPKNPTTPTQAPRTWPPRSRLARHNRNR